MSLHALLALVERALSARRFEFGVMACALLFELAVRSAFARRLLSRAYLTDLTYCAFYRLGIYAILLDRPINHLVFSRLTIRPVADSPLWLRVIAYLIVLDFAQYWVHRLQHSIPALWAVHQVHHSQEQLTIMTTYRNHPIDIWMRGFFGPVIFMVLFGVPPTVWLPLAIVWELVVNLAHLEVNWTYGPLRWLLVSPVSHSIHHSSEDRHHSKNLGMVLVVWDHLFGTADTSTERARAVGLPQWRVRESIPAHLWVPIRAVVRFYRGLPTDELAPLAPPPAASPGEATR